MPLEKRCHTLQERCTKCGNHFYAYYEDCVWQVECEIESCSGMDTNVYTEEELLEKYHLLKVDSYPGVK
jgi:hypothetical protein